ncbi:MAG: alpha/beta hydrolase [Chloroflexi bacterium]|nr:alpha/beta hydrolase [Chloroflexota bacterium]MYF81921.1 alpha/beta hydrolase [Chloroflexota bacterium]MYI05318.1 alpha/beta hydrolase [Chloroflexota bacterium]
MTTPALDIEAHMDAEHLAVLQALPFRLDLSDIPATRTVMEGLREMLAAAPLPDNVSVEDHMAPGPDGAPNVMVRTYRPASLPTNAPALYYIHGGGMVLGDVAGSDPYCANVADQLNVMVASVEYRLAPEHPFPAPIEDCYAGLRWFASSADEFGIDRSRIAIGGGSAGGGLAAGLALVARDRGEVEVCFQLLVFPMLDDRNVTRSSQAIVDDRVWNRAANLAGWDAYLSGNAGGDDVSPYAAPSRATDLAGLPPAYINVGTLDLFVDEDIAYAQALLAADVPVELRVYPGAFHGSNLMAPDTEISKRWNSDELAALDRALNGPR